MLNKYFISKDWWHLYEASHFAARGGHRGFRKNSSIYIQLFRPYKKNFKFKIFRIKKLPRFDHNNNVVASHVMQVSWSADHRVIDGATMANFSNLVKKYIENLSALIMDLKWI